MNDTIMPRVGLSLSTMNWNWTPVNKYFSWNTINPETEDIVVLTDGSVVNINNEFSKTNHKIAWLIESPTVFTEENWKHIIPFVLENLNRFDYVASCDLNLIKKYPEKFRYVPQSYTGIMEEEMRIYNKTQFISIVASKLNHRPGHILRHTVIEKYKNLVRALGRGYKGFGKNWEAFAESMFSIVIENCKSDGYYTDQIGTPLACGTIPIYWGCSNIGDYYDIDGIITFDTLEELHKILLNLRPADYYKREKSIKNNLEIVRRDYNAGNFLWEAVLKGFFK